MQSCFYGHRIWVSGILRVLNIFQKDDFLSILSKTMMQLLMRANKNALFAIYMNREPGTVIPAKAGIQSLQLRKNHWMPAPCLRRGMLFGHDEILIFFLKDFI